MRVYELIAYTDGGCEPNPGIGGWGFLLVHQATGKSLAARGGDMHSTNNRMEYMAAIELLRSFKRPAGIEICTDSQILVNTMTQWVDGWKKKGWRKSGGKPVKNLDLVKELYGLTSQHNVKWTWVKAHVGIPGNEYADGLATEAIAALRGGRYPVWRQRFDVPPVEIR